MTTRDEVHDARRRLDAAIDRLALLNIIPEIRNQLHREVDLLAITAEAGLVTDPAQPWEVLNPGNLIGYRNGITKKIFWLQVTHGATRAQAEVIVNILNEDAARRVSKAPDPVSTR